MRSDRRAALIRTDAVRGYARPHPGLLPQEKESSSPSLGESGAYWTCPVLEHKFPLLGERVRVREGVLHPILFQKTPHFLSRVS